MSAEYEAACAEWEAASTRATRAHDALVEAESGWPARRRAMRAEARKAAWRRASERFPAWKQPGEHRQLYQQMLGPDYAEIERAGEAELKPYREAADRTHGELMRLTLYLLGFPELDEDRKSLFTPPHG